MSERQNYLALKCSTGFWTSISGSDLASTGIFATPREDALRLFADSDVIVLTDAVH